MMMMMMMMMNHFSQLRLRRGIVFSRLVQIEHMSKLAPFLFIAQIAMFTALFLVIGYGLTHRTVCDADGVIAYFCKVHYELRESSFPIFLGIAVFALEGMPTVLLIESSMENPDDFDTVFARSMSAVVTLMVIFGTMGYWLFGAHTKSVISLNTQGMVGSVVKMLLCMVICLSYPLQFMPLTQIFNMVGRNLNSLSLSLSLSLLLFLSLSLSLSSPASHLSVIVHHPLLHSECLEP